MLIASESGMMMMHSEIGIRVHENVIARQFREGSLNPNLYVIAGPNGAGKTTFAREFLPNYADCKNFINADLIAEGVSPFSPEAAAFRAGRLMIEEIGHYAKRGESFGFETTLSGRSHLGLIRDLKKRRYDVHFFFLWVPTVSLALTRVRARVLAGGHNVPEAVVRRRFDRSIRNFLLSYRSLGDSWTLFNNSGATPAVISFQKEDRLRIMNRDVYDTLITRYGKP
jgi:predicted ABC-type ATPase